MRATRSRALTAPDIAQRRLANQQITAHQATTPGAVVAALGGMQAQDYRGSLWAVGLRLPGSTAAAVERAMADGAIVRTWMMRGTLHFVAAHDVRWMLALLAPRFIAASAYRYRQLGIGEHELLRSHDVLTDALSGGGPLARDEVMGLLRQAGVATDGQRGIHIIRHLSLQGLIGQVAIKGKQPAFGLLDDRVPRAEPLSRGEAAAQLAHRYFTGHGPATLADFVWWSGLTVVEARAGLESAKDLLAHAEAGGTDYWMPPMPPTASAPRRTPGAVWLLPGFDEYVLGYRDREVALDAVAAERVVPGGNGIFKPAIVVDGRVVGTWSLGTRTRDAALVEIFPAPGTAAPPPDVLARALDVCDAFVRGPATPA